MASINKIEAGLIQLKAVYDVYLIELQSNPDDFSTKMAIRDLKREISDLQNELYKENIKREKEIIEIRLKGSVARFGTFPLSLVGGLTNSFSSVILNSSKHFKFGRKGGKKIEQFLTDAIDLRLEGIGQGSTVFFVSAKTSPDLFGISVIQSTLENVFELLNSDSPEKILDNISIVGTGSIKPFSEFFKKLTQSSLEIDITWNTPNERVKSWNGTSDIISSLLSTINSIILSEPQLVNFEGEIITLSLKGRFEIVNVLKERFYGTFPNELLETIKQFHVGDNCTGTFLKTIITNPASGIERYEYALRTIKLK